jgi:hypothetical protein
MSNSTAQISSEEKFNLVVSASTHLLNALAIWTGVASVALGVAYFYLHWVPVLPIALSLGVLGGFIGLQRRLKKLDVDDLKLLTATPFHVWLSPLVAGFLAVILYVVFISGLLKGGLFPSFEFPASKSKPQFSDLFQVHGNSMQDYAKLIVWSFIAGFSENFVTNILGRFEGGSAEQTNSGH